MARIEAARLKSFWAYAKNCFATASELLMRPISASRRVLGLKADSINRFDTEGSLRAPKTCAAATRSCTRGFCIAQKSWLIGGLFVLLTDASAAEDVTGR